MLSLNQAIKAIRETEQRLHGEKAIEYMARTHMMAIAQVQKSEEALYRREPVHHTLTVQQELAHSKQTKLNKHKQRYERN